MREAMLRRSDGSYVLPRETVNRDVRSPLLILSALLFLGAVVFAVPVMLQSFDRAVLDQFLVDLRVGYMVDEGAQRSWLIVFVLTRVLALAAPLAVVIGLLLLLAASFARPAAPMPRWGLSYFSAVTRGFRVILWVVSGLLATIFLFRSIRYIALNVNQPGGVIFISAMLLPELVLGAVVAIVMFLTIKGTKGAIHTVDNLQYNLITGKCESYGLAVGAVILLALTGVAAIVLCVISTGLVERLAFGLAGGADLLLATWLQCYRRKNGRRALEAFRLEKSQRSNIA